MKCYRPKFVDNVPEPINVDEVLKNMVNKRLDKENKNVDLDRMTFYYDKCMREDIFDHKEVHFGKINVLFKKREMLDDNGQRPIILNPFKKLKIRIDIEREIGGSHKRVINEMKDT